MSLLDDDDLLAQERAIHLVEEPMCRLYKIFPIMLNESGRVLTVAMADPTKPRRSR